MSRIEKLSILGVRSFGPQHQETIAFNTPLTLIVGYNGSGKTARRTIIECLKYATTGELPPNSKGGAFVHDPSLAGEKDVRAQVKVSFRSTIGESYVVTRNVQLLVKKTTRTFKSLEGSLLLRSNGERSVVSSKVTDLSKLVPEKLGVSPAVLDCVIFCHQDESLWPMSEPAALKKRFDEIFEAQKYTKVIDNLKLIKKRKGEELQTLKLQLTQDTSNKERAEKVDRLMVQLNREIQESKDKCSQLLQEMDEETAKIKDKYERANSFLKILNDLQTKTEKLEYKRDAIEELRGRITEMPDSDQVLRETLDQYERATERTVEERDLKAKQLHALQTDLKKFRAQHTTKAAEQGKHQSDKDKYERQLGIRDQMIHDAAERHEIRGYDGNLDDQQIQAFNTRIQKFLNDKKRDLERLQRSISDEQDQKSAVIAELESRKSSRVRDRTAANQRIGTIGKESAITQRELSALDIDEGAETVLRAEMKDLEARIETAKTEEQSADLDSQIQKANDSIWNLEAQAAKLNRELGDCTRLASERAQLDLRKKQLAERRRDLDVLRNAWNPQLSAVVGPEWEPENIESAFQVALKKQNQLVAELRKQKDATQQELKQLEFRLSTAREKHSKLSTEKENCKRAVVKALENANPDSDSPTVDEFAEALEKAEVELRECEAELKGFNLLKSYYQKVIKKVETADACSLCERHFKGDTASKSLVLTRAAQKISDEGKQELMGYQEEAKRDATTLRAVRSQYDKYKRLDQELPPISKDITSMASQKEELIRRLEDHDVVFREADDKQQEMDGLSKIVLKISTICKDIADSERQIERSQQFSSIAMRSAEDIIEEQTACAEQTRAAQSRLSKMTVDRQRMKDHISQLELERAELRHKISNAIQQLERKKNLQDAIRKFKDEQAQQREAIQEANKDLEALEPEILSARTALDEARQQGRVKEQKITEERDKIATTVSELKMINSEIQEYLDRGGPSNLATNQRAIAALETTIANLESEIKDLMGHITKLNKEIDNSDAKKRNLADNLTYRKNIRERDSLEGEIEELKSRDAQEDYDRLTREARNLEHRRAKLGADRDRLYGSISTKDEQLVRLVEEYDLDLKDAAERYKETKNKKHVTEHCIKDLAGGMVALDNAIMHYHSLKMEEINRTVGELWQSTYQGTDIDSIQIRSNVESGAGSGDGKKNYNYRVTMVKGDTEMDMRGRCSAGQKVLASIIIRLALAESFGVNCGLIALDEPTTNLDSDNIRSLAESLHGIIKARQRQSNLQLIVITHDEEFLKHMQCSDFCDDFFRVKRDEKQNSIIVRESITRITE
ncbi:P-loop containing nucleoside triphosphate hydrolase protein [Podospora didyma]|uniref:DNA repair protein RAD50 n=1 Tax=Podospora didyma TaxID=330526 RepID=A0AAE0P5M9_9PEZI|nr:P-loop containing nucleoside triphosphate hydrolase protein [Podospora didyma]